MIAPGNDAHVLEALLAGRVTRRAGGHLELPSGLRWPGTRSNVLFVRSCYAKLFEDVLNHCKPTAAETTKDNLRRRIVTGQPGIGKTLWGCVEFSSADLGRIARVHAVVWARCVFEVVHPLPSALAGGTSCTVY
jgi:hypothetical protein